MSKDSKSGTKMRTPKSERTPEEQAKRDAKKAAKKAAKLAEVVPEPSPEESKAEEAEMAPVAEGEPTSPETKKRKREAAAEGEELEIDVSAPAPLSKAELRAARKKAKRGDAIPYAPKIRDYEKVPKSNVQSEEGKEGEKDVSGSGKRQNSVWIGNLAFKTTPEGLKEFLEKGVAELGGKGEGSVTRVNLPKKSNKAGFSENKGFAYVDFATPELQELGVQLSERNFEGRRLLIKKGDDHNPTANARTPKPLSTKAQDIGSSSKRPETSTLYMGNLPFDATEEALRDLIEGNAPDREVVDEEGAEEIGARGGKKSGLKKVRLAAFEDTGRCKGFAFLDFISARHAKFSLGNRKNHFFNGRRLNLEFASEEAAKRSGAARPKEKTKEKYSKPRGGPGVDDESTEKTAEDSGDRRGKKWETSGRPRPGAALAMAKRENVAIVEGAGQKITFD
ncbi:hypothetical protein LQV05_000677 [Cryptococcus neoformans]|nr:RNA-binding protein rnp24 [Cryptococcus neoformans var. grubii c45]OXB39469.1 RNA-binding protein rnp24 [Cryptococcus neoformans var. grubii]OXC65067.1 RNA-binding protein rnp24 [Cryptococcus neoformans var. grubii MW-RSA852]UOH79668.1 hypothetical protein LQV05_000677 [Cryptococcus neoformans]